MNRPSNTRVHPPMRALSLVFALFVITTASMAEPAETGTNRWEDAIAAFEAEDRQSPPSENAVLFVGSSSIRLWNLASSFESLEAINRGFGGSAIADSVHFFDRIVLPYRPRVIVLYAGDNDIARGDTVDKVVDDFAAFASRVRNELPHARLLFIAIKPSISRWELWPAMREANARIEALAEQDESLTFVDTATPMLGEDGRPRSELLARDGLHLSDAGYTLWTSILKPYLAGEAGAAPQE